jgi:hypothetical protein
MYVLLSLALFTALPVVAQTADTAGVDRGPKKDKELSGFIDANGDGIDDRVEARRVRAGQEKDKFIDADGDGICDHRAGGMGFRKGSGGTKGGTTSPGKTATRLRGGKR